MGFLGTRIGIIGAGLCDEEIYELARQTGRLVGERGGIVLCGGLGGVMEAACQGAVEAGALTIGILPGFKASEANRYVKIPIVTGLSHARNVVLVRSSQALISIGGSHGTLSEIALGLKMWKPVIGLRTWENLKDVHYVSSPEEAVDMAFKLLE
ncbi:MAG: TIGR00725 family protein [Thermodesulfobacteria bacterium]|nr:TIGR00725 family protein [Thermodesulfobacteriota bacterium]